MDEAGLRYGCRVLSDAPVGERSSVIADIVFVHGLNGHWIETWTHHRDTGTTVCWPQDFLPSDIPGIRVISFGYDADVTKFWERTGQNNLYQNADSLLTQLTLLRQRTDTEKRPIIFVGHSLGGLVVQAAIVSSTTTPFMNQDEIALCTVGVAFMGTPHGGSELADLAKRGMILIRMFKRLNSNNVKVLQKKSLVLKHTEEEFRKWLVQRQERDGKKVEVTNFYEELPMRIVGKVVSDESATIPGFHNVSIHGDHQSITRFANKWDSGYVTVSGILARWVTQIKAKGKEANSRAQRDKMEGDEKALPQKFYDSAILKHRLHVFVGRENLLNEIHEELVNLKQQKAKPFPLPSEITKKGPKIEYSTVVLQGLGGVGKTQAAIQYTHVQHFGTNSYDMVFWVDASNQRTAESSFVHIADAIGPSGIKNADLATKISYVRNFLQQNDTEYLLVLDNYDSPRQFKDIGAFIPCGKCANVIVTSRHRDSNRLGTVLHVAGMNNDEAVELLLHSSGFVGQLTEQELMLCQDIVNQFGNLPLAVDQAGAYMRKKNLIPSRFLERYKCNRKAVLDFHPAIWHYKKREDQSETEKWRYLNAFTTWELSLREVGRTENVQAKSDEMHPAAQLLFLSAFLDRSKISETLFERATMASKSHSPEWLREACVSEGKWNSEIFSDLVSELADYSLTENSGEGPDNVYEFTLHPLVQEWAKLRLSKPERNSMILHAIWLVADVLSSDNFDPSQVNNKRLILSNIDACMRNDEDYSEDGAPLLGTGELVDVTLHFASYYLDHGHYVEARSLYDMILSRTDSSKDTQIQRLNAEEGIGIVEMLEGNHVAAETRFQTALSGYTQLCGEGSYERLRALHNLTELHGGQGDYSKVVENYQDIVSHFESSLGPTHFITLRELEGLGNAYRACQMYDKAAECISHSLSEIEKILPPDHAELLGVVEGLAIVRKEQKRYEEAESLYLRALHGDELSLGANHPDTLNVSEELGDLWAAQGCPKKAIPYYERARDGRWEILGPEHPDTQRVIERIHDVKSAGNEPINYPTYYYPWYRAVSSYEQAVLVGTKG